MKTKIRLSKLCRIVSDLLNDVKPMWQMMILRNAESKEL